MSSPCITCNGGGQQKCTVPNCHYGKLMAHKALPSQKRMGGPGPTVFYTGNCSTCQGRGTVSCQKCYGFG